MKSKLFLPLLSVLSIALMSCSGHDDAVAHLKNSHLRDPESYEEKSCVEKTYVSEDVYYGTKIYYITYRAKNGYGGYVSNEFYACIDVKTGNWVCSNCSSLPSILYSFAK